MKEVDIKGGKMTFGQRLELGRILAEPSFSEGRKFRECMKCIDPDFNFTDYPRAMKYFKEVLEGLLFWSTAEKQLEYKPTEEERQAGIDQIYKATGEMATVMALAKDYGKDPDEILNWEYGKVFGILLTDAKRFEFERRLRKIYDQKFKNRLKAPRPRGSGR